MAEPFEIMTPPAGYVLRPAPLHPATPDPFDQSRFRVASFAECCGISIIHSAYGPTIEKKIAEEIARRENLISRREQTEGLLIYAATGSQRAVIKALKANKFKALETFRNPKTGATITLYGLVLSKPRVRKKAKR